MSDEIATEQHQGKVPSLEDLASQSLRLGCLAQGVSVIDEARGCEASEDQFEHRAREAAGPMIEILIERIWALNAAIEAAADAARKTKRGQQ